jgi:hypothetical protein
MAHVPLLCPLPPTASPHADAVQTALDAEVPGYAPMRFARYASRLYPDASPADLRLISRLFTWFFLLDDTADETRPSSDRLRAVLTEALATLAGQAEQTGFLAESWLVLRQRMPAFWQRRFVDAVRQHFDGLLVEAEGRHAGITPTVPRYVHLRRATSAAYIAHALTEFATGAVVPDAIRWHPAVVAYSAAGNDLLSWFNDLLTPFADTHNLVSSIAVDRGLTGDDAVAVAAGRWRARMAELPTLRAAVPRFGAPFDAAVRRFLDGVDYSVRGTIDWSLESARYRPPAYLRAEVQA